MNRDQRKILVANEMKILEGRSRINTLILSGILFLTFVGLGHSLGGLSYLQKRMDNPFTRWVNLPVGFAQRADSEVFTERFLSKALRDSFLLDTIRGYKQHAYKLVTSNGNNMQYQRSRTIEPDEPLMSEILKSGNILHNNIKDDLHPDFDQCWIVVKDEALSLLGYDLDHKNINYIEIRQTFTGDSEFAFFIPVAAIVRDLPDHADFVISEHFDALLNSVYEEYNFVDVLNTKLYEFLSKERISPEQINGMLPFDSLEVSDIDYISFNLNGNDYYKHSVYFNYDISIYDKFDIQDALLKKFEGSRPFTHYECNIGQTLYVENPHYLAINFDDLRHIRIFRDIVKADHGFDISLNQVEDKENFSLVTRLTIFLAVALFIVSLAGVMIFIFNLLIAHFDKIQTNLGTFKAFGLSNDSLVKDYTFITMSFFIRSLVWSISATLIYWVAINMLNGRFTLLHWTFILAMAIILIAVFVFARKIINRKLMKTPGDLIYNR